MIKDPRDELREWCAQGGFASTTEVSRKFGWDTSKITRMCQSGRIKYLRENVGTKPHYRIQRLSLLGVFEDGGEETAAEGQRHASADRDERGTVTVHRPSPRSFKLKIEAEGWLESMRHRYEAVRLPVDKTLYSAILDMLAAKEGRNAPSYIDRDKRTADIAKDHLSKLRIVDCTRQHLATWFTGLPIPKGEQGKVQTLASTTFSWLVENGAIDRHPIRGMRRPTTPGSVKPNPFTKDEARLLLKSIKGHDYESLFVVGLTAVPRPGELMGLQWEDIDFEARTIRIHRTLEEVRSVLRLKESPKTKSGNRTIALTDLAVDALKNHAIRWGQSGYVWQAPRGGPMRVQNFRTRIWHKVLDKAKLPHRRVYDVRHTGITLMLLGGVPVHVVAAIAGHASPEITLKVYAHVFHSTQQEFLPRIDGIFRSPASDSVRNSVEPGFAECPKCKHRFNLGP